MHGEENHLVAFLMRAWSIRVNRETPCFRAYIVSLWRCKSFPVKEQYFLREFMTQRTWSEQVKVNVSQAASQAVLSIWG